MIRRTLYLIVLIALVGLASCTPSSPIQPSTQPLPLYPCGSPPKSLPSSQKPSHSVTLTLLKNKPWGGGYQLDNGEVRAVIVPAVGRVMYYGPTHAPNLLWVNQKQWEHPPSNATTPPTTDWANWGGDRVCIWPQDAWPKMLGHDWPPPRQLDGLPWAAHVEGDAVVMVSQPVPQWGVRMVRCVWMSPDTGNLISTSWLQTAGPQPTKPQRWAAWEVTQVPHPDMLLARTLAGSSLPHGYKVLQKSPWSGITQVGPEFLQLPPQAGHNAKIGFDGDMLATPRDGWLLMVQCPTASVTAFANAYQPGERAQVYDSGHAYTELEFTAPLATITAQPSAQFTVVLSMQHLESSKPTAASLLPMLRR